MFDQTYVAQEAAQTIKIPVETVKTSDIKIKGTHKQVDIVPSVSFLDKNSKLHTVRAYDLHWLHNQTEYGQEGEVANLGIMV